MKNHSRNFIEAGAVMLVIVIVFGYGFFYPRVHPERSVSRFLNAMTSFNSSRVAKNYAGSYEDFDFMTPLLAYEKASDKSEEIPSEKEQQQNKDFSSMLYDFTYELGKRSISGKTATVEATVHAYPIGETYLESKGDRAALLDLKKGEKSYTTTTTFSLIMKNGYWYVDTLTDENKDALSGGLHHILAELNADRETTAEEAN